MPGEENGTYQYKQSWSFKNVALRQRKKAFELCAVSHKGQYRQSKDEFYIHPFSVAKIIISLGMASESIAASLLHDVVEDTKVSIEEIIEYFKFFWKQ